MSEFKQQGESGTPRKSRFIPYLLSAIIVVGGGWLLYRYAVSNGASAQQGAAGRPGPGGPGGNGMPQPVQAATVARGDLPVYLSGLGTVTALNTVTVKSQVSGTLQKLHFAEGATVKAGQLLAEIDPRPFQVQLEQAQGQFAKDQAALASARQDLERYRTLLTQDSIAQQQVDSQVSSVRQLEASIKMDQAQIDSAKLQLTYSRITAPISGRAGLRQVDPGNLVQTGDSGGIVVLTEVDPINIVFTLPEVQLPRVTKPLREGRVLEADAWDRDMTHKLATGRLTTPDNQIDPATGTIKLKAIFANSDGSLFPNQFVNIRLKVDTDRDALIAPVSAIQQGSQGSFVWVIVSDGESSAPQAADPQVNAGTGSTPPQDAKPNGAKVSLRVVKTGASDGDRVVIQEGVQEGDRLVTDGADRLREGARVEIVDPQKVLKTTAGSGPQKKEDRNGQGGQRRRAQ